ncbi:hypothetical protein Pmani_007038 [Petrolisthes manimaculis]|uniref:Uncharacterized protein n=1 Tax=Petrolisthes manimaculis TaxID=1843537 RepID=A0AAE1QBR9_9EUCA|nr:hypothetical protein Pmani_007038 [Petrolisthes manimaculis]
MLERTGHWKQSQTKVVVVGERADVKDIFLHHSFRNTVDGIYLAVNPNIFITQNSRPRLHVQLPYKDQLVNFEGRQLKFIASSLFPYVDFPMDIDETAVPIIPYDTVDVRLADTLGMKHNFTPGRRRFCLPLHLHLQALPNLSLREYGKQADDLMSIPLRRQCPQCNPLLFTIYHQCHHNHATNTNGRYQPVNFHQQPDIHPRTHHIIGITLTSALTTRGLAMRHTIVTPCNWGLID